MAKVLSTEDGDLQTPSILTSRQKVYKDIDLTFEAAPNGDVYKKTDAAAVKQAVKNLILTNRFEKPFRPSFGADVRGMLFELSVDNSADEVEDRIIRSIQQYEPRARILDLRVDADTDNNEMRVYLEFQILNTDETASIETTISRLR